MGQLDYSSFAPTVKIQTPFELQSQMNSIQQGQNQNRLAQMQFEEANRTTDERNQLRDAYRQATDENGVVDQNKLYGLVAQSQGEKVPGIQKTYNDAQSSAVKLNNDKLEGVKRQDAITDAHKMKAAQAIGAHLNDPNLSRETLTADIAKQVQSGELPQEQAQGLIAQIPQDPAQIKVFLNQILTGLRTPDQQLNASHQNEVFAETKANNQRVDARARAAMNAEKKPVYNADAGGFVSLPSAENPNGKITPLAGAAPKKLTEVQGKAAMFGARAEEADKTIADLEGKYSRAGLATKDSLGSVWGVGGALGAAANSISSDNNQKVDQAQRDFVNAVLRQESGAAIAQSEFENAKKQYFPQVGDSKAVVAQKARNRQTAIVGFKSMAGTGAYTAPPITPGASTTQSGATTSGW